MAHLTPRRLSALVCLLSFLWFPFLNQLRLMDGCPVVGPTLPGVDWHLVAPK